MGDLSHWILASMSGMDVAAAPAPYPQDVQNHHHLAPQQPMGFPAVGSSMPSPYESWRSLTGFSDPYRRTKSGCYTCRIRRVKCDETHPICDRCRKAKRECTYPNPKNSKFGQQSALSRDESTFSQTTSPISSHEEEGEAENAGGDINLGPIPDNREPDTRMLRPITHTDKPREMSTTLVEGTKSPSSSGSTPGAIDPTLSPDTLLLPDLSQLPQHLHFYLSYFYENITNYHYRVVSDPEAFFRSVLPGIAFQNEALLYAVVGFSAYHHALQDSRGRIQDFLQYYNRSVSLLLNSLKRKEHHGIATLLTILQLATIEEYLGDLVNLMGHQRAAFEIITHLFTPQAMMQSPITRMIHSWYVRFDVFTWLLGGVEPSLPRDWYTAYADMCAAQAASDPDSPAWKIEECSAQMQLISLDVGVLFSRRVRKDQGDSGDEDGYGDDDDDDDDNDDDGDDKEEHALAAEHRALSKQLAEWRDGWNPGLEDRSYLIASFDQGRRLPPRRQHDTIDFAPATPYDPSVFVKTLLTAQWHSVTLMLESHCPTTNITTTNKNDATTRLGDVESAVGRDSSESLRSHALAICQIFEAAEQWPGSPKGCLISMQSCLAMAALYGPHDGCHQMWLRKRFAMLESMGCVFPMTMRSRMAEMFKDPSCNRWWLPRDEGFGPLLRDIRTLADERNAAAMAVQSERPGDMKRLFTELHIGKSEGSY